MDDESKEQERQGVRTSRRSALLLGLVATIVGALQVASTLVAIVMTPLVTVIAALRLYFCGSLLVVGALVLVNLWRDHREGP